MAYLKLITALIRMRKNIKRRKPEIQRIQQEKLTKLLLHAYRNSEYYRKSFKKAGIREEDIGKIPLSAYPAVDKEILVSHFDELVTTDDLKQEKIRVFDASHSIKEKKYMGKYHLVHSSGSTGIPRFFVYDEDAWMQMILGIIRGALWDMSILSVLKLIFSHPGILYIAATDGRYGGAMAVADGIDGIHAKQMTLDIKTPLSEWRKKVEAFSPTIIIGYPSAIKILSEELEESAVLSKVSRVITCGEPLNASMRQFLEKTYKCPVINFYGASESLAIGVESEPAEGMYLFDDMNYIEVFEGQMYLTCLYNYTQPLIRYKISDQLQRKNDTLSKCQFARSETPLGRNEDILWFYNSSGNREFLHPLDLEGICVEGLMDYQFKKMNSTHFEMIAEVSRDDEKQRISKEIHLVVEKLLADKQLNNVTFSVRFMGKIFPDSKTGKKKLVLIEGDGEQL
ncbi:MAG: phenylacetate--CoA ligase family protein [Clostridia bacterium]|nr:AMP-binding protein [Lachnospiraceae bacterium]NCB99703.1 phenylacetate--CoA ligase family protein [Clostridia bacterium]NCD01724.1 phenylacetate--CoA ligase family protein [Clostridia bacterium]